MQQTFLSFFLKKKMYVYVCVYTLECVSVLRQARDVMWLESQHQHYSRMFEGQSVRTVAKLQIS